MKRSEIKKLDALWSRLVRERAGHKCEYCLEPKREFKGGPGIWLEAAHIIGRTNRATRWLLYNGMALCSGCHASYDQHLPKENDIRIYLVTDVKYQKLRSIKPVKAADQVFEVELKRIHDEALSLNDEAQRMEKNEKKRIAFTKERPRHR